MRHLPLFMCTAFCGLYSLQTEAADKKNERPNILWLTFEDTSAYEFGCYGNGDVHTPNADSLAARGIQFMNAWVCGTTKFGSSFISYHRMLFINLRNGYTPGSL